GRSSGSLAGIEISCSCGAHRSMAGAFNEKVLTRIGVTCSGGRPWLGQESERRNAAPCGAGLIVVQKGASNVYFPHVRSSIYLPQWERSVDRRLAEVLEKNWTFLSDGMENGEFQRIRFELVASSNFTADKREFFTNKLLDAARKRIVDNDAFVNDDSEERYRKMEYDAILEELGGENGDFYVTKIASSFYKTSRTNSAISDAFESIGLLHKLRETRAFVGFSRWLPDDGKTLTEKRNFLRLGQSIDWLPAVVIKGEGVFFEFNERRLKEWAAKAAVVKRVEYLAESYN